MNILKTRGIVLKDYELFEQDKIVTFYTQNFGMLKVVAKGARKIKSRFSAAVQFPSYVDILVYKKEGTGMGILTDCGVRHLFSKIRKNILKFAYASYLAEILLSSLKGTQVNEELFYLLLRVLFFLEQGKKEDFEMLISSFKLKLLHILGYTPELRRCVECGKNRDFFKSFYFTPNKGGIICQDCQKKDGQVMGVPKFTILAMDCLLHGKVGCSLNSSLCKVEKQINYLLDIYFLCHLEQRNNNSRSLIKRLEKLG